jgi:hypothetical protein
LVPALSQRRQLLHCAQPGAAGSATLTVTATDAAGNASPGAFIVTGTPPNLPEVPVITAINDDATRSPAM